VLHHVGEEGLSIDLEMGVGEAVLGHDIGRQQEVVLVEGVSAVGIGVVVRTVGFLALGSEFARTDFVVLRVVLLFFPPMGAPTSILIPTPMRIGLDEVVDLPVLTQIR
jgi:hypothetical protein